MIERRGRFSQDTINNSWCPSSTDLNTTYRCHAKERTLQKSPNQELRRILHILAWSRELRVLLMKCSPSPWPGPASHQELLLPTEKFLCCRIFICWGMLHWGAAGSGHLFPTLATLMSLPSWVCPMTMILTVPGYRPDILNRRWSGDKIKSRPGSGNLGSQQETIIEVCWQERQLSPVHPGVDGVQPVVGVPGHGAAGGGQQPVDNWTSQLTTLISPPNTHSISRRRRCSRPGGGYSAGRRPGWGWPWPRWGHCGESSWSGARICYVLNIVMIAITHRIQVRGRL